MALDMINIVKPFKIISNREESDGGQGVTFSVSHTEYLTESKTRTIEMTNYIYIPAGEDVDAFLFSQLSEGGWI